MAEIPAWVKNFPDLIDWLIDDKCGGVGWNLAREIGVSSAIIYQWRKRLIHQPQKTTIQRLAQRYDLDPRQIYQLTFETPSALPKGESPEERARAAITKDGVVGRGKWRKQFEVALARQDAEALYVRAFREDRAIEQVVIDILEAGIRKRKKRGDS